ncbi:MAG: hypothetical protein ACK4NC_06980 [Candidatus Gracilibacteria bacterium]
MLKYQIAISGAASAELSDEILQLAYEVGKEIGLQGHITLTGACGGIGVSAVRGAKSAGGNTLGIAPADGRHDAHFETVSEYLDTIVYTGAGYKGRNVIFIRSADAVITINGKSGTLSEACMAIGEKRPLIVLKGSGACADNLLQICTLLGEDAPLVREASSPKEAVALALEMLSKK